MRMPSPTKNITARLSKLLSASPAVLLVGTFELFEGADLPRAG